jgi:hypothetical protein
VGPVSLAGIAYLGASLLQDSELLWISGRSLEYLIENQGYLAAIPGVEKAIHLEGKSPLESSCLLYGDSGLPNQPGPLAPDKIVFRDGWSPDSSYLLLNLRFTGWHRYKATNTATLYYQGIPLLEDKLEGRSFNWLPSGRSFFRDKRIPRENLSGFFMQRTGLGAVIQSLTGIGSIWAQDPPYYAVVQDFHISPEFDQATIQTSNWHGWEHTRTVYFYHQGPVIIFDHASHPDSRSGAIAWHFGDGLQIQSSSGEADGIQRFFLQAGRKSFELVLMPFNPGQVSLSAEETPLLADQTVQFQTIGGENLSTISIFLPEEWIGTGIAVEQENGNDLLMMEHPVEHTKISIPLPSGF